MWNAKQLDNHKFDFMLTPTREYKHFKTLQRDVRSETSMLETKQANMLISICEKLDPDYEERERIIDVRVITDNRKFNLILSIVSDESQTSILKIKERRHYRNAVIPRSVVIFLARWVTDFSLKDIGRYVVDGQKGLDHSSCLHACQKVVDCIKIKDNRLFPLLKKVIWKLGDEGIEVNLKNGCPEWFMRLMEGR